MVRKVRIDSGVTTGQTRVNGTTIMDLLNRGQELLATRATERDSGLFEVSETIDFVAGTQEYDLPRPFWNGRIKLVESLDTSGEIAQSPILRVNLQDRARYNVRGGVPGISERFTYYLRGQKIGFTPRPATSQSAAIRIWATQQPHDMFWGVLASGAGADLSTTTFRLDAVAFTATVGGGNVPSLTDYLKNARVRLLAGGSSRGVERTITAYNATTKVATIDSAWTVADVQNSQFVILSGIPDQYHQAMVAFAVLQLAAKDVDESMRTAHEDTWRAAFESMSTAISPRAIDAPDYVMPPADDEGW